MTDNLHRRTLTFELDQKTYEKCIIFLQQQTLMLIFDQTMTTTNNIFILFDMSENETPYKDIKYYYTDCLVLLQV